MQQTCQAFSSCGKERPKNQKQTIELQMHSDDPELSFTLFCFSNDRRSRSPFEFLSLEGTLLFQYVQFPFDFEDCTCMPCGGIGFWSRIGALSDLEHQWYRPRAKINRTDITQPIEDTPRVNKTICHAPRSDRTEYILSSLHVSGNVVQQAAFHGKSLVFSRMNQQVTVDLRSVPDSQPFSVALEWSPSHIEARVTWLEGKRLEKFYSGEGVKYEQFGDYQHPEIGEVVQYRERKEFDVLLIPAEVARVIWRAEKSAIDDGQAASSDRTPRKAYRDQNDFMQTLKLMMEEVQHAMVRSKPHAFWDKGAYGANSPLKPKKEPEAGCVLRTFFELICAYKNITVTQEDPARSGNVDFSFDGISTNYDHLTSHLEIKNAHSRKVENGLVTQLPIYLKERGVKSGFYGVLWYKGINFGEPAHSTMQACIERLISIKPECVDSVIGFDCSFRKQASKS